MALLLQFIAGNILALIIGAIVGSILNSIVRALFRRREVQSLPAILGSFLGVFLVAILPMIGQPVLSGDAYAAIILNFILVILIPLGSILGGIIGSVFGLLFSNRLSLKQGWISFVGIYLFLFAGFYLKDLRAPEPPLLAESLPLVSTVPNESPFVCCMAFSPDGRRLAVANSADVRIWQIDSGKVLISLKGTPHTKMNIEREQIEAIAFSPDNTTLATATAQIIKVIDSKTGQLLHQWDGGGDVQFTPNGRTLVGFIKPAAENAQASLRAWDVKSGKILQTIPLKRSDIDRPFPIFDISSKGDSLIVAPDYGNRIEKWDLNTGKIQQTWASDQQGQITTLALTPDDQTVILAQHNSLLFLSLSSGKIIQKANAYSVLNLMVDQREDQLLSENRSELMLWQLKTGDRLAQWRLSGTLGIASKPVVLSPDGQLLATYTHEGPIKLWQLKSESSSRGQR
ncbi:hypothetical protein [Synechococcus elongatus]|uniref:WD40 repeat domain-containing protein n=1 Tax=Synechococcus elongatus PCC 11801 TaxID=2219813 RepID=A0AAN1QPA2_SYNEL|nr:hypothetical protein [Synechococcus elongatus]AZB72877.1 hypothetical protein DOP62_09240 [Synechococcus elongatus PCC 11801]